MNSFGQCVRLSIFGESHGTAIGVVIDGLPAGEAISEEEIAGQMARRSPGGFLSTPRREADRVEILSGLFQGHTTGAPLCGIIRNTDARPQDYTPHLPRPGHADLTAFLKYGGFADYRGGGHFSGRITAPLVFAGAVARQILERRGVSIGARIAAIGDIADKCLENPTAADFSRLADTDFPVFDREAGKNMQAAILEAQASGDSLGGVIEGGAFGLPPGLGSPFFGSVESRISAMLFSIPGVKGVEFGAGFSIARMSGKTANDPIRVENGRLLTATNRSGGINGGITNGMPLIVRAAMRPTPSIPTEQDTVDLAAMENTTISTSGRHDPCIVLRGTPVLEAGLALCILDAMEEAHLP